MASPKSLSSYIGWQWPQKGRIRQHGLTATQSKGVGEAALERPRCGSGVLPGVILLRLLSETCLAVPVKPRTPTPLRTSTSTQTCPVRGVHIIREREGTDETSSEPQSNSNANETGWSMDWNPATYAINWIVSVNCNKPLKNPFPKKNWSKWTCPWILWDLSKFLWKTNFFFFLPSEWIFHIWYVQCVSRGIRKGDVSRFLSRRHAVQQRQLQKCSGSQRRTLKSFSLAGKAELGQHKRAVRYFSAPDLTCASFKLYTLAVAVHMYLQLHRFDLYQAATCS